MDSSASSVGEHLGHWGCFHILGTLNGAVMNTGVQILSGFPVFNSFETTCTCEIPGPCGNSMFNFFEESSYCFP